MEGTAPQNQFERRQVDSAVVRFAGDSGDGMQLTGSQFTLSTALFGNDLATFPDYPAEIRAPAGTTFGVSAFQINFGGREIMTSGDAPDVLVAMNPAALKVHLGDLKPGGLVVVDSGAFNDRNLKKAGYEGNPLEDGSLDNHRVLAIDISRLTLAAVEDTGLAQRDALRCKNMWTLGLTLWMFGRDRPAHHRWHQQQVPRAQSAGGRRQYRGPQTPAIFTAKRAKVPPSVTLFHVPRMEFRGRRIPRGHRRRGAFLGPCGRRPAGSTQTVFSAPIRSRRPPACCIRFRASSSTMS